MTVDHGTPDQRSQFQLHDREARMGRLTGLLGLVTMLGLAYLFSSNRRAIRSRPWSWDFSCSSCLPSSSCASALAAICWSGRATASRSFWSIPSPAHSWYSANWAERAARLGMIFAFQVLPTVIFISAFFAVLYHYGVMQFIIRQMAKVMIRMGASGAESLDVAASIFMGQTEAPLTIRPYLPIADPLRTDDRHDRRHGPRLRRHHGRLHSLRRRGQAPAQRRDHDCPRHHPDGENVRAGNRRTSHQSAPQDRSDMMRTRRHRWSRLTSIPSHAKDENVLGAITRGTIDGLHLALNIAAMLISFLALIALVNGIFGGIHNHIAHWFPSSLEQVFGVIFAPIAFVIGIPWHECGIVGNLLGTRMVINELVAYGMLGAQKAALDPRSFAIATFALCGFANFSSIGIQIGGISALAPNKRGELAKLGFRAMIAGTMANLMSASIVGILLK